MCGFAGCLALAPATFPPTQGWDQAATALASRGPDAQGFYHSGPLALVHRRLSIIDLTPEAGQPMTDAEGRFTIAYNGEIINFRSLRTELQKRGITFRTRSDTEVLLELWKSEGPACLLRLNGFFAFAVWDAQRQELFLARDRLGIKPLFYGQKDRLFCFGSELKALIPFWGKPQLNSLALAPYFMLTYVPAPLTMCQDINKLPPGHWIRVTPKGPDQPVSYWSPLAPNRKNANQSYQESVSQLKELLIDVVNDWLVADVPVGIFLSGGIDSAVICLAAAARHLKIQTFSVAFSDEPYYDETPFALMVAEKAKTQHHVLPVRIAELREALPAVLDYLDEPFADSSALAVSLLSQRVRQHVSVALSGDGGDELFGGYQKHRAEAWVVRQPWIRKISFLLPLLRMFPKGRGGAFVNKVRQAVRILEGASMEPCVRYLTWASFGESKVMNTLLDSTTFQKGWDRLKNELCDLLRWNDSLEATLLADLLLVLPNDMLTKTDRMSMMHSLEVRPPFLDNKVVELALSLPTSFKVGVGYSKKILRDAFRDQLPASIYSRGKRGFEVPLRKWFLEDLEHLIIKEYLSDDLLDTQGIFNKEAIRFILRKLQSSDYGDSPWWLWSIVVFQHWYKKYVL
ncbi:MAG: asparagine synthase (glutamine-hydrolyzing) [Flavobacteriales bacterium]|nr:asparagine synthase (glutamine-hydrolyzing) [Flavobacteriales bacterium]MCX7768341.1 asparagine synthase (glutamine-hydrolyzing) [Flavobacteriales bacterium]MDW8409099.1 asparagine synthase (glutamine-hydrolyzing) [Flavobacteriales bacterium]